MANDIELSFLSENEKAQLKMVSENGGMSEEELVHLGIKMVIADQNHFQHLLSHIYNEGYENHSNYRPDSFDAEELKKTYEKLNQSYISLKKLTDDAVNPVNPAPNAWKDCLRDFLLPEIEKAIEASKGQE